MSEVFKHSNSWKLVEVMTCAHGTGLRTKKVLRLPQIYTVDVGDKFNLTAHLRWGNIKHYLTVNRKGWNVIIGYEINKWRNTSHRRTTLNRQQRRQYRLWRNWRKRKILATFFGSVNQDFLDCLLILNNTQIDHSVKSREVPLRRHILSKRGSGHFWTEAGEKKKKEKN